MPADDVLDQVRIQKDESERERPAREVEGRAQIGVLPDDDHPGRENDRREKPERGHRSRGVRTTSERSGGHAADVGLPQMLVQQVHRRRRHRSISTQVGVGQVDAARLHGVDQRVQRGVHHPSVDRTPDILRRMNRSAAARRNETPGMSITYRHVTAPRKARMSRTTRSAALVLMTTVVVGALTGCVPEAEAETPKPQPPPDLVSGAPSDGGFYMYCTPINRTPGFYCTPVDGSAPPNTTPPLAPPTVDPPAPEPTTAPSTTTTRPPLFEGSPDPTTPAGEPTTPPTSDAPAEVPSDSDESAPGTGGAAGVVS
ncbi:hypothetical protein [Pseudonocardia petroleophila]|uniref:hypothetical protein n=1 Tax=Pseudonocardia petroleophila TaxID=37331 RepID=UPI0031DACD0C